MHPDTPAPGRHPVYGDLPAQVHGLAVRFRLRQVERRCQQRWVLGTYVLINSAISITIVATIAALTKQPFLFPSLGPTAFLLFYDARGVQAAPRNVFCGHLIGVLAGYLALVIFGLTMAQPDLSDITAPRIGAVVVCLCLTVSLMVWLHVPHSPAASTTLMVGLGLIRTPAQLSVLMLAVALMIAQGTIINRLARVPYPLWAPQQRSPLALYRERCFGGLLADTH
ncbi:MAG TPA: HPP family protein [Streptosporangiaceae bacterium]|nr:HPP family protein [Streptosporangiaceae bacterium]